MVYFKSSLNNIVLRQLITGTVMLLSAGVMADVFHVSQKQGAADSNTGTQGKPYLSINRAARVAKPGDTVIVHEGTYREWVKPVNSGTKDKPITYMAAPGERVVISGSEQLSFNWQPLFPENKKLKVSKADLPDNIFPKNHLLPGKTFNPFKIPVRCDSYRTPQERFAEPQWDENGGGHLVIGEVYVNGIPLIQMRTVTEVTNTRGTFCVINKGKTIVVNFHKWSGPAVEVSVRPYAFAPKYRGTSYINVKGFIFEHATSPGTYPCSGMVSTRTGHHWTIENNIIRYCGMVGLEAGSEVIGHGRWARTHKDQSIKEGEWAPGVKPPYYEISWNEQESIQKTLPKNKVYQFRRSRNYPSANSPSHGHIIRNNLIHNCGLTGIFMAKCDNSLIENNLIERCNRRYISADRNHEVNWNESAAIKMLCSKGLKIIRNITRDNMGKGSGIWFDNHCMDNIIDSNIAINNYYGIYLEYDSGTKTLENIVSNNIAMFNRIDGFNSSDSTAPILVANNLFAYNGRWGCAAITTRRSNRDNSPFSFRVYNNVFIGNQRGAFRMPLLDPEKWKGNCFSGNVFKTGTIFQTETGARQKLTSDDMINEMKRYLTKAGVDKKDWPDFTTWTVSNKWYWGRCHNKAFMAAVPGQGNIEQQNLGVKIYEAVTRFRYDDAEGHPVGEHVMPELKLEYILVPQGWASLKVKPAPGIKTDFMGNKLDAGEATPGPFQNIQNNTPITFGIMSTHKEKKLKPGLGKAILASAVMVPNVDLATEIPETGLTIKAEQGAITEPMKIVNFKGEKVISSTGEFAQGQARYDFETKKPGVYVLWGQAYGKFPNNDSFIVIVDKQPLMHWDVTDGKGKTLAWQKIKGRKVFKDGKIKLEKGKHTIVIKTREKDTKLAKLFIGREGQTPPEK